MFLVRFCDFFWFFFGRPIYFARVLYYWLSYWQPWGICSVNKFVAYRGRVVGHARLQLWCFWSTECWSVPWSWHFEGLCRHDPSWLVAVHGIMNSHPATAHAQSHSPLIVMVRARCNLLRVHNSMTSHRHTLIVTTQLPLIQFGQGSIFIIIKVLIITIYWPFYHII